MKFERDKKDKSILIYPSCYTFAYAINGKRKQSKLADINTPVEAVRIKAAKCHALVLEGKDPFEKSEKIMSVQTFANSWFKYLEKTKGPIRKKHYEGIYKNYIKNIFSNKDIKTITNLEVKEWFYSIKSNSMANKSLMVLKKIFNEASAAEYTDRYPFKMVKKYTENVRENYLTLDQLVEVIKELNSRYKTPSKRVSVDFIWACILTGARSASEIGNAKWEDLKEDRIILDEHKTALQTGKKRTIYLNAQAKKIIERQIKTNGKRSEYIFSIKTPYRMWKNIRAKFGLDHITLHDLRHSFASHCISYHKMTLKEVGDLLGHKSTQTTERYAHLLEETTIKNVNKMGQFHSDLF
tara:strand:- start:180 stop:1238 length:1059 start_codon:yes stop_codon:yes gene_type:complete